MAWPGARPLYREGSVLPPAPPAPPAPDRVPAGGGHDCPVPAGENVKAFFSRVAALAFERSVLQDLEQRSSAPLQVGGGDVIRKLRAPGLGRGSRPTSASTTLCWDSTRHLPGLSGPLSHPADLRLQVPRLPGSSGAQSMPGDFSPCCRDGGTSTRGPGQQEALRPELLLARPASRGLPTLHEACRWCVRDMEGDTEHPPC